MISAHDFFATLFMGACFAMTSSRALTLTSATSASLSVDSPSLMRCGGASSCVLSLSDVSSSVESSLMSAENALDGFFFFTCTESCLRFSSFSSQRACRFRLQPVFLVPWQEQFPGEKQAMLFHVQCEHHCEACVLLPFAGGFVRGKE